jgi:hypothetical protein
MGQMQGAQQQQQPGFGPPQKKGNAGLIVGIVVGLVVLVLIIVVVVASGKPSPQEVEQQKTKDAAQARKDKIAKEDAERKKAGEKILAPIKAASEQASSIESAIRNENAPTLEGLFDWTVYAAWNKTLVDDPKMGKKYLNNPLFGAGEWEKNDEGLYTGKYIGKAAYGPDGLKTFVMDYIKDYFFGASELKWEKAKTESDGGQFTLEVNGAKYYGRKVFISYKGGSKTKEFWLGAPPGSTDVRILNFVDGSAMKALAEVIKKKNPRRTSDQNMMRDPNETKNGDNENPEDPPQDPDANLPAAEKTGAMPVLPHLVNAVNEMRKGSLNRARTRAVQTEPNEKESKATMGAFIDLLIDAVKSNDRRKKANISSTLYEIWSGFCYQDMTKEKMVYSMSFDGQSSEDLVVRRWILVYNNYNTDD